LKQAQHINQLPNSQRYLDMQTFMFKRHEQDASHLPSQRNLAFSNIAVNLPKALPSTILEGQNTME
jgi:hypothetical protein